MKVFNVQKRLRGLLVAFAAIALSHNVQALLMVNSTAADIGGGKFHWDFSVTNTGPTDFVIVSLDTAPMFDPFIDGSLTTPSGFLAAYDEMLGIVDFLEDSMTFAAGTTAEFFSFDAGVGPIASFFDVFTAIDLNGGIVQGPVGVPEPMTLSLLAAGGLLAGFAAPKRKILAA